LGTTFIDDTVYPSPLSFIHPSTLCLKLFSEEMILRLNDGKPQKQVTTRTGRCMIKVTTALQCG
jgi:hypothetical protein